jgi:prepilin-type N-terminal cleavage/methylation domain-containing protein
MKQHGFTLVEILITVAIMVILLTLTVANISSTQVSQRDSERAAEIGTIANNMETFYKTGVNTSTVLNRYPSTALLANGSTSIKAFFPYIDLETVTAPDAGSVAASFIPATNAVETVAGVMPQPSFSQYVYQPIQSNGALCTTEAQECRRFALYYHTETDDIVKKVSSKHQ